MFLSVPVLKYVRDGPSLKILHPIHRLQFCKVNTEISIVYELSPFGEKKLDATVISANFGALK